MICVRKTRNQLLGVKFNTDSFMALIDFRLSPTSHLT